MDDSTAAVRLHRGRVRGSRSRSRPSGKTLWSEVPEPEGGFRLLLVHLYESLNSVKGPTRRVYVAAGQVRAE